MKNVMKVRYKSIPLFLQAIGLNLDSGGTSPYSDSFMRLFVYDDPIMVPKGSFKDGKKVYGGVELEIKEWTRESGTCVVSTLTYKVQAYDSFFDEMILISIEKAVTNEKQ